MKVLVTGADGFVGNWVIRRLLNDGREVSGAIRPAQGAGHETLTPEEQAAVRWLPLELTESESVRKCADLSYDAVIHLAAVASSGEAAEDPGFAWNVNAAGTARLAQVLGEAKRQGRGDPVLLVISTYDVYGRGPATPRRETDTPAPCTPYAASKLAGEIAALEVWRRTGLRTVIARPCPHTGPGQHPRYVVPRFARMLLDAKRLHAPAVKVGDLEPVREFLDVRDVVDAYARLLAQGTPGEVYNVARGEGTSFRDLFFGLADLIGVSPIPETDPKQMRSGVPPILVADPAKLRAATGWTPRYSLTETLRQVVDAQAH
ncbi:MAG TPA: NAD-dependent epimerase/dehydratase family protein [Gemmatimonadales bacterium]